MCLFSICRVFAQLFMQLLSVAFVSSAGQIMVDCLGKIVSDVFHYLVGECHGLI